MMSGMTDDVAAVLAAEDRRYQAMIDTDLATLDRMLDDRLSYAHSSGARDTKAEYLEKVRSGYYDYLTADHPVERVEVVGDTAEVVGRMTGDLTVQGVRETIDTLALAVWVRADGDWRLLAYAPTTLPACRPPRGPSSPCPRASSTLDSPSVWLFLVWLLFLGDT